MKYKILADNVLKALEDDFIAFLITHGVENEEWRRINEHEPDRAIGLVEIFSDVVWEKALKKTQVIEHCNSSSIKLFLYEKNKAVLVGVNSLNKDFSFEKETDWAKKIMEHPEDFELFTQEKSLNDVNRESEIFNLLETGCVLGSNEEFEWLLNLFKQLKT